MLLLVKYQEPVSLPLVGHSFQALASALPCSVLFSFLGRDFFNALSAKDQEKFYEMLVKWLGGIVLGVPVYVLR